MVCTHYSGPIITRFVADEVCSVLENVDADVAQHICKLKVGEKLEMTAKEGLVRSEPIAQ